MSDRYDAIVIGTGPAGETAASRLVAQGMQVALCERELIGGECAYWACIPSKTSKAEIPLGVLRDTAPQFPTFSEAYREGVEKLGL